MTGQEARQRGLLSDHESLRDDQTLALIFEPEFSTCSEATTLSGRGLGLAIVREQLESLGGQIFVDSQPGKGSRFRLEIPLTLATLRGIFVRVGGLTVCIPLTYVTQVLRFPKDDIRTIENMTVIPLNGQVVSLVDLATLLERTSEPETGEHLFLVVIRTVDRILALQVEQILYEQEIIMKPLQKPLMRVRNIAGTTIVADGQVVPVLNIQDLAKSAVRQGYFSRLPVVRDKPILQQQVLVVDDSLISRMLMENILRTAGLRVQTAIDGLDALPVLKSDTFDLVVSDVEMPNMDGFELTRQIRQNEKWAELPIVLITTRDTREDKEKGILTGANAYLVKGNFEQANFLDTVKRLI